MHVSQSTEPNSFIICAPRSGSTLLSRQLDSHTAIASPFEIGIPGFFLNDKKESIVLRKHIEICRRYQLDPQSAIDDPKGYLTAIRKGEGKDHLVVKDPHHSTMMPKLYTYFGDVPIIHLVRDARSTCQSVMFDGDHSRGLKRWFLFNDSINRDIDLFSRVLPLRYEDLTEDAASTLEEVTAFLGFPFEPAMVEYWNHPHADNEMQLWNSDAPEHSDLQAILSSEQRIVHRDSSIPDEVQRAYEELPEVVELNESLGYG